MLADALTPLQGETETAAETAGETAGETGAAAHANETAAQELPGATPEQAAEGAQPAAQTQQPNTDAQPAAQTQTDSGAQLSADGLYETYIVPLQPVVSHLAENASGATSAGIAGMLADAMREETRMMGVTAGTGASGMPPGFGSFNTGGIESAIMAAAATGEVTDAQIALLMLCAMMQGSQDGDFSMLMQMMASMLTKIEGDAEKLRSDVMSTGYDPYVLYNIDREVFHTRIPGTTGTGEVVLPLEIWKPTTPAIVNVEGERDPLLYRAVLDQFNVETAARYRPFRNGYTYCNIYVWDATSAMGAEIPHYIDPATGAPRYYPDIKGTHELGAIAIDKWLRTYGESYGWREVDAATAQSYANMGKPAVTTAGEIGHVQMVCPSADGGYDELKGVTVAQAGAKVANYTYITNIYGAGSLKNVRYFVHE